MGKYKAVLIVGPKWIVTDEMKDLYQQEGMLIIGDGKRTVPMQEIQERLTGNIDSNTRIDISGHGNVHKGQHIIQISTATKTEPTASIINTVAKCSNTPTQVHLWSCFGGAAAKDVQQLPTGSCLIAHAPENTTTLIASNNRDLVAGVIKHRDSPASTTRPKLNYQNILNNLSIGAGQKSFFASNLGTKTPLIVKDRLPENIQEHLGVPEHHDTICSALMYHYEESYKAIAKHLDKTEIPGVIPPFLSSRRKEDISTEEVQNFHASNFIYQIEKSWDEAYQKIQNGNPELYNATVRSHSARIAVLASNKPEQLEYLLEKGLNPNARINYCTPDTPDFGIRAIEYCAKHRGAKSVIPFIKHDKNFSDIELLNKTNTMFDVLQWAHENNRPKLEKKIQKYIVEKDITISPTQATKISPESAYAILKGGVKNNNASKNLEILYTKIEQNDNALNKLAYSALEADNKKFIDKLLQKCPDKLYEGTLEDIAVDAMEKDNPHQIIKLFDIAHQYSHEDLKEGCLTHLLKHEDKSFINHIINIKGSKLTEENINTIIQEGGKEQIKHVITHAIKKEKPEIINHALQSNKVSFSIDNLEPKQVIQIFDLSHKHSHDDLKDRCFTHLLKHEDKSFINHIINEKGDKLTEENLKTIIQQGGQEQIKNVFRLAVKQNDPSLIKVTLRSEAANFSIEDLNDGLLSAAKNGQVKSTKFLLQHPFNQDKQLLTRVFKERKKDTPGLCDIISDQLSNIKTPKKDNPFKRFAKFVLSAFSKKDNKNSISAENKQKSQTVHKQATKDFAEGLPRPKIKIHRSQHHLASKMRAHSKISHVSTTQNITSSAKSRSSSKIVQR